jgi:hypothetical protein
LGVAAVGVALLAFATDIQWVNVALVIELLPTCTTASPGMPPHADRPATAKKTAPSAEVKRNALDTTRAL